MELKTYFAQDASGNIMPGATVMVYEAATTTLATGLQDESGAPLANPFTADSSAKVAFYAPDGLYDITVVGNGRTVTIRAQFVSVDGASVLRSDLAATGGSALVGYGAGTVKDALDSLAGASGGVIDIRDYGAALDGVTNDAAALLAANAAAVSAKMPLLIPGVANIGTATVITAPLVDGLHQMFTPASSVTINNGLPVRPDWFGSAAGNIRRAVDSLPSTGGTVLLADKTYPPSYDSGLPSHFDNRGGTPGVDYMVKPHVRIQGTKLPEYNSANTALQNGSIIQGTFYVSSECHGFQADLIGCDAGRATVDAIYAGVDRDCFCILQTNKTTPVYGKDIHIGTVIGLCSGTGSQAHALLFEAIDGGSIQYAEGRKALHGVVIKSKNIRAGKLVGSFNHGEDVILKSDNYANLASVDVDSVVSSGSGSGYGLQIHAATFHAGTITIGTVTATSKAVGTVLRAETGWILGDVIIGKLITQSCPYGYAIDGAQLQRTRVSQAVINASTYAVDVSALTTSRSNWIDSLSIEGASYGAYVSGKLCIGDVYSTNVTSSALYHTSTSARIYLAGGHVETSSPFTVFSPALQNSWVNHPGGLNDLFSVSMLGGKIVANGLIRPGSSGLFAAVFSAVAPERAVRFACLGYNGTAWSTVEVLVTSDGNMYAGDIAACSDYLSLRGVEWDIKMG